MAPPFALPPPDFPLPAYVRRADSGLLLPDQRLRKAVLPGLFTPPGLLAHGKDPHWDYVTLLMKFDTVAITDSSPNAVSWITSGSAATSTIQKKFGDRSLRINADEGTGHIRTTYVPSYFNWFDVPYTLECWVYYTSLEGAHRGPGDSNSTLIGNQSTTSFGSAWAFGAKSNGALEFSYWDGSSTRKFVSASGIVTINAWHHICFVNHGSQLSIYYDGTRVVGPTSHSNGTADLGLPLVIGEYFTWSPRVYVDELRITRGVARYSGASFAVPTAPFPIG